MVLTGFPSVTFNRFGGGVEYSCSNKENNYNNYIILSFNCLLDKYICGKKLTNQRLQIY